MRQATTSVREDISILLKGGNNILAESSHAVDYRAKGTGSLLDMLRTYAHSFVKMTRTLAVFEQNLSALDDQNQMVSHLNGKGNISKLLEALSEQCQTLQLTGALARIKRINQALLGNGCELHELRRHVVTLNEIVADELETRQMLFVSNPDMYDVAELLGSAVAEKFPSVSYHAREAGSCLAVERSTASIFHLMCVLDVGLDSLSHYVGLEYSEKSWHTILRSIEDETIKLSDKGKREFCSEAVLQFRFIKDAWRNHTQHGRAKFTPDEAKLVFDHIKPFMEHLATRLEERPDGIRNTGTLEAKA